MEINLFFFEKFSNYITIRTSFPGAAEEVCACQCPSKLLQARLRHTGCEGSSTLATAVFALEIISFLSGI